MSGLVEFFTLEAGEYLERLDGLLARAGGAAPALDVFLTDARALRGSATMAKQNAIADVASGLERVAKSLRDGAAPWNEGVRAAMIAAVDDLKILVRNVRAWTPADDQRALARTDELTRLAPAKARSSLSGGTAVGSLIYLAVEAADVAAALDGFAAQPSERASLLGVLPRVRALRGMASLRDLPPLADVVEAIEEAAKPVELGIGSPNAEQLALLRAAAAVLRAAAHDLRGGAVPNPRSAEALRFIEVISAGGSAPHVGDAVVPIAALFFADAGPHIVSAAPTPPTTPGERFRMEVVSQAEHLQRLVGDARAAQASNDDTARARTGRALRNALLALKSMAESFTQHDVAKFVVTIAASAAALDAAALMALGEAATLLADPRIETSQLSARLRVLAPGRSVDAAIGAGFSPVGRETPASVQRTEPHLSTVLGAQRTTPPAARGADLQALLASGIAGLNKLEKEPFSPPAHIEEEAVLIDEFLYRGRAALDRARALRGEIRERGTAPDTAEVEELFALMDLAATE